MIWQRFTRCSSAGATLTGRHCAVQFICLGFVYLWLDTTRVSLGSLDQCTGTCTVPLVLSYRLYVAPSLGPVSHRN